MNEKFGKSVSYLIQYLSFIPAVLIASAPFKKLRKHLKGLLGKRLKFSFSQPCIEEDLSAMQTLNEDFRTLVSQADHVRTHRPPTSSLGFRIHKRQIVKYRQVREASKALCLALGEAYTRHTDHLAHLGLDAKHNTSSRIHFNLLFEQYLMPGSGANTPLEHAT